MHIRRTHTNNSATGERYFTYRLVKSERVGGSTRQSTLLNLGRHFAIGQDYWPTLCARIDVIMGCQLALLPIDCPLAVEREAQHVAALLLARRGVTVTSPEPVSKTASPTTDAPSVTNAPGAPTAPVSDPQSVDVASLELHRPQRWRRTVGAVGNAAVRFPRIADQLGRKKPTVSVSTTTSNSRPTRREK